jgi:hypothetical protein
VRRLGIFALTFVALVALWMLYVGIASRLELLLGLVCAAVAAAGTLVVAGRRGARFAVDWPAVAAVWKLPQNLVYDFVLVFVVLARALARRQRVRGVFVVRDFPAGGAGPGGAFRRGWLVALANSTPNALVVDLPPGGDALMHALEPEAFTAKEMW